MFINLLILPLEANAICSIESFGLITVIYFIKLCWIEMIYIRIFVNITIDNLNDVITKCSVVSFILNRVFQFYNVAVSCPQSTYPSMN